MTEPVWAVGVTSVPERSVVLWQTVGSLIQGGFGGFNTIHLFTDGGACHQWAGASTIRDPRVGAWGNWWLALNELYIRNPKATRIAIFQDDILCVRNARQYIDATWDAEEKVNPDVYRNLCLYPQNYAGADGWYNAFARGLGAQGLVFSRDAVKALLGCGSEYILGKPSSDNPHKGIDGAVYDAMAEMGYTEIVHSPSLICHRDEVVTTLHNLKQPPTARWNGEAFDAMSLIQ